MSLNANANSWTPNASAMSFVPSFQAPPAQQQAAPVEQPATESWEQEETPEIPSQSQPAPVVAEPVKPATPEPKTPVSARKPKSNNTSTEEKSTDDLRMGKDTEYTLHDEREHVNVVFIGHVDAGKSTISGQVLLSTGMIDARTIEKFEREAKERNRESWWIAYILDTSEEERAKGKTVEVGFCNFETKKKRYTILDAPGHKNYVPNMVTGASQADIGVLVISTRTGEFEAGFDRQGQTREHAMLAKTIGINKLIVAMNKMDDGHVAWSEERFEDCRKKLFPFLKQCGYKEKDLFVLPCSGLTGDGIQREVPKDKCPWFKGTSLLNTLDSMQTINREHDGPLRIPVLDSYKDMGDVVIMGKVENGTLYKNSKVSLAPRAHEAEVVKVEVDETEVSMARSGENVLVYVKGISEGKIHQGDVICSMDDVTQERSFFDAQVMLLELLPHKPVLTAGYQCIFHCNTLSMECEVRGILSEIDKKTGKPAKRRPRLVRSRAMFTCRIKLDTPAALETYKSYAQLGRFTLRDEGVTIGVGKIMKLVK